ARFDRAGAAHAVIILLDPQDCGEAAEIMLLDSSDLTEALAELRRNAKRDKVRLTTTALGWAIAGAVAGRRASSGAPKAPYELVAVAATTELRRAADGHDGTCCHPTQLATCLLITDVMVNSLRRTPRP